jgi:hypothetical protein
MSAIALLHADSVRNGRLWHVEFNNEMVVLRSRDPEFDLARVLLARGVTGSITILDSRTGKPRTTITDIEKAAGLCTEEGPYGPRFVERRQTRVDRAHTGGTAPAGVPIANSSLCGSRRTLIAPRQAA